MGMRKGLNMIKELVTRRANGYGFKAIAKDLGLSRNTVKGHLKEVGAYEIEEAEAVIRSGFHIASKSSYEPHWSTQVDWCIARDKVESGTPIKEFWESFVLEGSSKDLQLVPYETFWREFRRRYPKTSVYYHKHHEPGVRSEIDYKGDTPGLVYVDKESGEFIECRLFGHVLCNSRLFFPFATLDEKQSSWFLGIENGFKYFGGATSILVVDNTKSAVNKANWFDPELNLEFTNFCQHYGTTVIPARPYRPTDKNLIEVHLGVFWRWVRMRLRNHKFFSLGELNRFLKHMADKFNHRQQRRYGSSRRERFISQERAALKPLPNKGYEYGQWFKVKCHEDSHIQYKYNFYSCPYGYIGRVLDVRATAIDIEIFYHGERLATHKKRPHSQRGNYSTQITHLPKKHQAMEELSVQRQIAKGEDVGPHTGEVIKNLLTESSHPMRFLRRTMGILRFKGYYGPTKLDRACQILLQHGVTKPTVKEVERMVKSPNLENKLNSPTINRNSDSCLHGQESFTLEGVNSYTESLQDISKQEEV